jgi:hypothetical protein
LPRSRHSSLPEYRPVSPEALAHELAEWLAASPGIVRVAVDGAPCADPHSLAASVADPLRALGRPFAHVRAESFWRDASLRYEHGREDVEGYLSWLDEGALRREVLSGARYLPSLRDPRTNRVTREPPRPLPDDAVLAVSGAFLLGLGLPFQRVVHLAMSPAARRRRTPPSQHWTLAAFDRYDSAVRPADLADVVVRLDDPRHPAVLGPTSR